MTQDLKLISPKSDTKSSPKSFQLESIVTLPYQRTIIAMIQEPCNPEFYIPETLSSNSNSSDDPQTSTSQSPALTMRYPFHCLPLPGVSKWVSWSNSSLMSSITPKLSENTENLLVYVADNKLAKQLKINDIVLISGLFSPNELQHSSQSSELSPSFNIFPFEPHNTLSTISAERVEKINDSFYPFPTPMSSGHSPISETLHKVRNIAISHLSSILYGDSLAAEYLLYSLISRITNRSTSVLAGHFPLNIFNFPQESVSSFSKSISHLVTRLISIPMSISQINSISIAPSLNSKTNTLDTGLLQASNGTVFILDETKLSEGEFLPDSLKKIAAIQNCISRSIMTCDYITNSFEIPCDYPIITLSNSRSILNDYSNRVPLIPVPVTDSLPQTETHHTIPTKVGGENLNLTISISQENIQMIREYLATIRRLEFSVSPKVSKAIEDYWVNTRSEKSVDSQAFSRWLVLGRYSCISNGRRNLTLEDFVYGQLKDAELSKRLQRQNQQQKANGSTNMGI